MTSENSSPRSDVFYIVLGVAFLVAAGFVVWNLPGDAANTTAALNRLKVAIGYTLLALIFLFGFAILISIAQGRIDLSELLSEVDGKGASMSRFQLLLFTLVISLSLFMVIAAKMEFPPFLRKF